MGKTTSFTIVELEQGTPEWREWRHNGIGASDAPSIMGENRFKSFDELLQEKCQPPQDSVKNKAMILGNRLEPEARSRYIAATGKDVRPVCIQSTTYEWFRASLDGLSVGKDSVVEIKCGASVYRKTSETRLVPAYYYGQLQHIMSITGLGMLDLWCYWPGYPELLLPVERNDAYIERLLNKELEFWNRVKQNR